MNFFHSNLVVATTTAEAQADFLGVPLTVHRIEGERGYSHSNPYAINVNVVEAVVSILPSGYFR